MKVYDAASIRNVAVVGHGGCGKTQLVSALLFAAGMVNRLGLVDDGTTVDRLRRRGNRPQAHAERRAWRYAEWNKTKINLIDTPGSATSSPMPRAALHVADAALVVVDAVAGVEVQTEKAWQAADELALPRLDLRPPARSRSRRRSNGPGVAPADARPRDRPDPAAHRRGEPHFTGVVDLVAMKAYTFPADGSTKGMTEGPVPPAMEAAAAAAREALSRWSPRPTSS